MKFIPMVMWSVWGLLALITAALSIYRTGLTRDEDDQIYLDEAFDHEKAAQEAIIAKVNKIEPALKTSLWLVGGATVLVVLYYLWDVVAQFK
jgi:anaerobic C4-dicarboxylate transporter